MAWGRVRDQTQCLRFASQIHYRPAQDAGFNDEIQRSSYSPQDSPRPKPRFDFGRRRLLLTVTRTCVALGVWRSRHWYTQLRVGKRKPPGRYIATFVGCRGRRSGAATYRTSPSGVPVDRRADAGVGHHPAALTARTTIARPTVRSARGLCRGRLRGLRNRAVRGEQGVTARRGRCCRRYAPSPRHIATGGWVRG